MSAIIIEKVENVQIVNVQVNIDMELASKYYYNGIFDQIVVYIKGFDILLKGIENLAVVDIYKRFEEWRECHYYYLFADDKGNKAWLMKGGRYD